MRSLVGTMANVSTDFLRGLCSSYLESKLRGGILSIGHFIWLVIKNFVFDLTFSKLQFPIYVLVRTQLTSPSNALDIACSEVQGVKTPLAPGKAPFMSMRSQVLASNSR